MKDVILKQIEETRILNNNLWMELLRIALEKDPKNCKEIIRKIRRNDEKISAMFGMLAGEENGHANRGNIHRP